MRDLFEVARILCLLPAVELGRRRRGPKDVVAVFRARGLVANARSSAARARLRRLIRAVDARVPGGGNCYRRTLLEIGLDPVSARETVFFGLREHGGPRSGHAWLASDPEPGATYDAELAL